MSDHYRIRTMSTHREEPARLEIPQPDARMREESPLTVDQALARILVDVESPMGRTDLYARSMQSLHNFEARYSTGSDEQRTMDTLGAIMPSSRTQRRTSVAPPGTAGAIPRALPARSVSIGRGRGHTRAASARTQVLRPPSELGGGRPNSSYSPQREVVADAGSRVHYDSPRTRATTPSTHRPRSLSASAATAPMDLHYPPHDHVPPPPPPPPKHYPDPAHFPTPPSYPPVPPLVPSGSSSTSTRSSAYTSVGAGAPALSSNDLSTLIGRYVPDQDQDLHDDAIGAAITTDKAVPPPAVTRSVSYPRLAHPPTADPVLPHMPAWGDSYAASTRSAGSSYEGSPGALSVRGTPYSPLAEDEHEHLDQDADPDDDPPLVRRRPPVLVPSSRSASMSGLTSASEDETDADPEPDSYEFDLDSARTAAIVVAEEGRGLIVHGEGMSVAALNVQPGTTHLLLSSLATPNSLPALLTQTLPAIAGTLLALDISANYLGALPPALAACTQLTELNVASNPLRVLPVWLTRLTGLRVLIADATGLTTLPHELGALTGLNVLSLRRNRLMSLPAWLAHLPTLERLAVEGNPFQGPWQALLAPLVDGAQPVPATPAGAYAHASFNTSTTSSIYTTSMYAQTPYSTAPTTPLPPAESPSPARRFDEEEHTIMPGRAAHLAAPSPGLQVPGSASPTSPTMLPYMRSPPASTPVFPATARTPSPLLRTRTTPSRPGIGVGVGERRSGSGVGERRSGSGSVLTERGGARPRSRTSSGTSAASRPHTDYGKRAEDSGYYGSTYTRGSEGSGFFGGEEGEGEGGEEDVERRRELRRMRSADELRRALESVIGPSEPRAPQTDTEEDEEEPGPAEIVAPQADVQHEPPFFVARLESGTARHTLAQQERARPGVQRFATAQGLATRTRPRPALSDAMWDAEDEADEAPKASKAGKWGFLKKMSMGKMKPEAPRLALPPSPPRVQEGQVHTSPPSANARPPTAGGALGSRPTSAGGTLGTRPPSAAASALPPPPSASPLLAPPPVLPRSAKRRSFLPLDGPPTLNIPIPSTAPFLGEHVVATNGTGDEPPMPAPVSAPVHPASDARALRSVMAYLRDMADLGMAAVPAPSPERVMSEGSFGTSSGGSASVFGSTMSGVRSAEEQRANNTMSVATTDSSGSGGGREEDRSRHKDDKAKRALIIKEIVDTERTYVKGLQELIDIYVKPASQPVNTLGNAVASTKETVVPQQERKIVFNGLDSLFSFHKQSFLPALEKAALARGAGGPDADAEAENSLAAALALANVFVSHAAFMRMYSTYINNFDSAVHRLKQWTTDRRPSTPASSLASPNASTSHLAGMALQMSIVPVAGIGDGASAQPLTTSQRKRIKSYLKRCRLNPQHSQLNLEGYLLLPVQRIPRYRLLLDELVRCTPPKIDAYDDPLDRALTEISSLANNMNEGKRESESRRKLVQWQTRIRGKFPSPLVQPHRRLIMDGGLHLTRVVRKSSMAFDVINSSGDKTNVQVECLAPEETPRSLVGILCNDLLVLCKDASAGKDHTGPVDLWAVLRMQTLPQPASIVHGSALRVVDNKAILYFDAPSTSEALTWCRAINMHIPASKI